MEMLDYTMNDGTKVKYMIKCFSTGDVFWWAWDEVNGSCYWNARNDVNARCARFVTFDRYEAVRQWHLAKGHEGTEEDDIVKIVKIKKVPKKIAVTVRPKLVDEFLARPWKDPAISAEASAVVYIKKLEKALGVKP